MRELLLFLANSCQFLFLGNRFRLVDSGASESFGGNAYVTLQSRLVRLRLVRDRGQRFIELQALASRDSGSSWSPFYYVRELISASAEGSYEFDEDGAAFLASRIDEIEQLFAPEQVKRTISRLREIGKKRTRDLAG